MEYAPAHTFTRASIVDRVRQILNSDDFAETELGESSELPPLSESQCQVLTDAKKVLHQELKLQLNSQTLAKYPTQCPISHKVVTVHGKSLLVKYVAGKEVGSVKFDSNVTATSAANSIVAKQNTLLGGEHFKSEAEQKVMQALETSLVMTKQSEENRLGDAYDNAELAKDLGEKLGDSKLNSAQCAVLTTLTKVLRQELKLQLNSQTLAKYPTQCPISHKVVTVRGKSLLVKYVAGKEVENVKFDSNVTATKDE